jgi:hypothetical protein
MSRILITCFGSYGDLFPYIALGKALQARNHEIVIGTTEIFRHSVEAEGLHYCHIRCGLDQYSTWESIREFMLQVFDPIKGGEYFVSVMMGGVEQTYQDTHHAAQKADIVISNPFAFVTPVVCQEMKLPWMSTILAPMFSCLLTILPS